LRKKIKYIILDLLSAVRAVSWGEGTKYFATAADPFTSREQGSIAVFDFPSDDVLLESKSFNAHSQA